MPRVRRSRPQARPEAEGGLIFSFIFKRWEEVFTVTTDGKLSLTTSLTDRILEEAKNKFRSCKLRCRSHDRRGRYNRVYRGYIYCNYHQANGVCVEVHRISRGAIRVSGRRTGTCSAVGACMSPHADDIQMNAAAADSTREAEMARDIAQGEGSDDATSMPMLSHVEELDCRALDMNELTQLTNSVMFDLCRGDSSIHYFSVVPVCVTYMSVDQLEALKNLRSSSLTLHVAPICSSLTHAFGLNKIQQHSVFAFNPVNDGSLVSLCEFLSQTGSTEAMAMALTQFRDRATKYIGLESSHQIANRIEMCFSSSVITAVIQVFFDGKTVSEYLNMCWRELLAAEPVATMSLHVRPVCAVRAIYNQFKKNYQELPEAAPSVLCILKKMVTSERVEEVVHCMGFLLTLCASRTVTAEVDHTLRHHGKQSPAETTSSPFNFHACSLPDAAHNESLHLTSPFGSVVKEWLDEITANGGSGAMLNPLYCPSFVTYLCSQVLPYAPLVTNIMVPVREGRSPGMARCCIRERTRNQDQQLRRTSMGGPLQQTNETSSPVYHGGGVYQPNPEVISQPKYADRNLLAYVNAPSWSMPPGSSYFPGRENNIDQSPAFVSAGAAHHEGATAVDPLRSIEELVLNVSSFDLNVPSGTITG